MKILVCISNVPDTTAKVSFSDDGKSYNKSGVSYIIGPYDDYALARAVELRDAQGGTITVLNVGGADAEPQIRKALAIGADTAVRIDAEPTDSLFVANQITAYAQGQAFDLILMGRESIDFNSGVVHGMVASQLGIESYSPVMSLDINGTKAEMLVEIDGGKQKMNASLPLVLGCQEPIAEWKIPNMRGIMSARTKPLEVLPPFDQVSGTKTLNFELTPAKTACKMIPADQAETLIEILRKEAKVL